MDEKKTIKVSLGTTVCIFIIILLIVVLGVVYYLGFVKDNAKEQNIQSNITEQNSSIINTENNNEIENNKIIAYKEFAVAKSDGETTQYIIAKDQNNNWNEIFEEDQGIIICGQYNNKLYFTDEEGFKYIDLTNPKFIATKWIDYEKVQIYDNGELENRGVVKAVMVDDIIYFEYNGSGGGTEPTDGIQTIRITDTSLDNAKQFISNVDFTQWEIDCNNKQLYYIEWRTFSLNGETHNDLAHSLFKYDLSTGKQDVIIEGISQSISQDSYKRIIQQSVNHFKLYNDKILCLVYNQSTEPDGTGHYPVTYSLHLYDINSKEDKIVHVNPSQSGSNSGGLWSYAEYHNNDVYYKSGDSIVKYNNGKNDVIYTYSPNDGGEYFYGFYFIDNNIIDLVLQNAKDKYLIDGKVVSNPTGISTIIVNMIDGSTKTFTVNNILEH